MSTKPINLATVICLSAALILLLIAGIVPSTVFPTALLAIPGVVCLIVGIVMVIRNRTS